MKVVMKVVEYGKIRQAINNFFNFKRLFKRLKENRKDILIAMFYLIAISCAAVYSVTHCETDNDIDKLLNTTQIQTSTEK